MRRQKRLRCMLTVILLILLAVLGAVIFYKTEKYRNRSVLKLQPQSKPKRKKAEEEKAKAAEQKSKSGGSC